MSKFGCGQKAKASTARMTMWRILNIPNVFTIEASFFGPSNVKYLIRVIERRKGGAFHIGRAREPGSERLSSSNGTM